MCVCVCMCVCVINKRGKTNRKNVCLKITFNYS